MSGLDDGVDGADAVEDAGGEGAAEAAPRLRSGGAVTNRISLKISWV
jgi:hypothetical protein